jgi:hypothetical protein
MRLEGINFPSVPAEHEFLTGAFRNLPEGLTSGISIGYKSNARVLDGESGWIAEIEGLSRGTWDTITVNYTKGTEQTVAINTIYTGTSFRHGNITYILNYYSLSSQTRD